MPFVDSDFKQFLKQTENLNIEKFSMIPTTELEARHGIPGCTYSIHRSSIEDLDKGKPAGTAIQFAKVGDKVLHQWHCDDGLFLK